MDIEKLKVIAYAQGFVEGRLEELLGAARPENKETLQELFDSYIIVSQGLDALRRIASEQELKLLMARNALV